MFCAVADTTEHAINVCYHCYSRNTDAACVLPRVWRQEVTHQVLVLMSNAAVGLKHVQCVARCHNVISKACKPPYTSQSGPVKLQHFVLCRHEKEWGAFLCSQGIVFKSVIKWAKSGQHISPASWAHACLLSVSGRTQKTLGPGEGNAGPGTGGGRKTFSSTLCWFCTLFVIFLLLLLEYSVIFFFFKFGYTR